MSQTERLSEFQKSVKNKFNVYNSLFLNLPYTEGEEVGILIPLLFQECEKGLKAGKHPTEILDGFFASFTQAETEEKRIDLMFRIIQYVERQVVLYDSVEDAAFSNLHLHTDSLSIRDFLQMARKSGKWDEVAHKLDTFSARIVLTAHPTQFYTPAVLDIISELRELIMQNRIDEIDVTLQQLGLTSLINRKKPTPLDEAKNIIHILRHIYYDAAGDLYTQIKSSIGNPEYNNPDIIKLGFWPGGDRDGNPYVTADITRDVADALRTTLMKCYNYDLKELQKKLSFPGLQEKVEALRGLIYLAMFNVDRQVTFEQIIEPLLEVRYALIDRYHSLYLNELDAFIDKVRLFRTHFATLDIRQDHSVHRAAVEAILKQHGYIDTTLDELGEERLLELLSEESLSVDPEAYSDPVIRDTLVNIAQLGEIQAKNGEAGCNRYIISNSEDIYSVLFVYGLFRWCGWERRPITFDIVPLFETMAGMDASEPVMQALFAFPFYREHLIRRENRQTMMLGFSDGTKDGGYLKANWSIFKTKENLTQVCKNNDVRAVFFDGRGGPPARGGGKTHRFYAAQTDQIANEEIQLTVQGQTITSTFGTREQFIHNSEQLLTAGLSNTIYGEENTISPAQRELIETLSELSFEKYNALKHHEKFISYLEERSTLRFYNKANIGSRPGKRGNKAKLELTDLRAISFVGSWSQLKQNVPGYFGIGTALKMVKEEGRISELKALFREVAFFKALMLNSMMSLTKSYFELTAYMEQDPEFGEFWRILKEEYLLSKEMLLEISGYTELMEDELLSRESIRIREQIVLPLLVIQQAALQKINEASPKVELYEKIITRSLYGNINASRNSA
ncbi:phosphoenolpyruvate carboxylase [Robiginitalea sp.]|uniref:phosphoenolpyruvate carboxylase n=1 Tax=Robiginitalea sp. TaxID=1902411 RepID=UPI003C794E6F